MAKPVLFVDTNFLIHIYGQAPETAPRGQNYDVRMGEGILDDLSSKYDIRVTRTVLNEATVLPEFTAIKDWFERNDGAKTKIYETTGYAGKNAGEMSIADLIQKTGPDRDPTLPPAADTKNIQIASLDKYFRRNGLADHVVTTQQVAEAALADGTLSRAHYDLLEQKTGDILRARGGFRPAEQVYAEHGVTPPATVTQSPPAAPPEAVTPPLTETAQNGVTMENAAQKSRFTGDVQPTPNAGSVAAPAIGLVLGAKGMHDAIKNGDGVEGTIAGVNLTTSGLQATETMLEASGNALPALSKVGKFIPGVNVAATVADGVYQISREDTALHKVERGTVVAATATTGLVLGTATASAAEAGVITAGVTGLLGSGAVGTGVAAATVAAAPVVLTVAAVGAVAYTGEKVIETKRVWDDLDKSIIENGAPQKRANVKTEDGKPSIMQYRHIAVEMLRVSGDMKDENLRAAPKRDLSGRIHIDEIRKMDMRDPKNIAELERALDLNIKKQEEIMKANDSILPKWLRGSDSVSKFTMAQMENADLQGAKKELEMYRRDLKDYDAAHPGDPATTAPATKPKTLQTSAPK